jgi:phenylacetate-CoA ligase
MIWNEKAECMSVQEREELQLKRLQEVVKQAYNNVPYYRDRFDQEGVAPEDIQTLEDIEKLPFTSKSDLRDAYPFGMFAVHGMILRGSHILGNNWKANCFWIH